MLNLSSPLNKSIYVSGISKDEVWIKGMVCTICFPSLLARMMMTVVYSLSGKNEQARAEADEVIRIQPKFFVEKFRKKLTYNKERG